MHGDGKERAIPESISATGTENEAGKGGVDDGSGEGVERKLIPHTLTNLPRGLLASFS